MNKRFLDFIASLCLVFDVDWEEDYPDDEYVIAYRKAHSEKKARPVKQRIAVAEAPSFAQVRNAG